MSFRVLISNAFKAFLNWIKARIFIILYTNNLQRITMENHSLCIFLKENHPLMEVHDQYVRTWPHHISSHFFLFLSSISLLRRIFHFSFVEAFPHVFPLSFMNELFSSFKMRMRMLTYSWDCSEIFVDDQSLSASHVMNYLQICCHVNVPTMKKIHNQSFVKILKFSVNLHVCNAMLLKKLSNIYVIFF